MAQAETGDADDIKAVIERLSAEFGDRIDTDTIRRIATQEVGLFGSAKVRTSFR